jgi:Nitroreductase family
MKIVESILDHARWAPSGDNSQPWRFEIASAAHVVVHGVDTRGYVDVYDRDGRASQVALGAMLETMRISASVYAISPRIVRRPDSAESRPIFDVFLDADPHVPADPLNAYIRIRSVQRRPLSTRALSGDAKQELERSVGPSFTVVWFGGWRARLRIARFLFRSAKIRLTIPEAYAVHREIIEWGARFSESRVPDQALGADALTTRFMRWAMGSWERISFMNRYFGGTLAPRIQLEFIPGLMCAAHFALIAREPPATIDDYIAAGAAVQRFWLTATQLKLRLQPQYTPLVFAAYARTGMPFTQVKSAVIRAGAIAAELDRLLGVSTAQSAVFMGRVGAGPAPTARSLRLPMEKLQWIASAGETGSTSATD